MYADITYEGSIPSSLEAEKAILGAILLDDEVINQAIELLKIKDFYLTTHQLIYKSMLELHKRGEPIDGLTLADDLRKANSFDRIGGMISLSALIDGVPRTDSIEYYARMIKRASILRQIMRTSQHMIARASEYGGDVEAILDEASRLIDDLKEQSGIHSQKVVRSFDSFMAAIKDSQNPVAFGICRRELSLVAAVTNRGKSTLIRNALIELACGNEFSPLISSGEPLRVLLLDFETSAARLKADLETMTHDWSGSKLGLLRQNFFIVCESIIGDDLLNLNSHMNIIEREAKAHNVDLIAVDTASAAFDLYNENDNSEVGRRALKPLLKLARKLNAAIVLAHHIGKVGNEEARTAEKAYRARGASAFGCSATSVFTLTPDTSNPDLITLTCAKRKDGVEYEQPLKLNRKTRWFEATGQTVLRPLTSYQIVIQAVQSAGKPVERSHIDKAIEGKVSKATISRCLSEALSRGDLNKNAHGVYSARVEGDSS